MILTTRKPGRLEQLAIDRHHRDLERYRHGGDYYYDLDAAQRVVDWIPRFVVHTKGLLAGQPFILTEWERDHLIAPLYGWRRRDNGTRRFRIAYVQTAKKNGKTMLAASLGLYHLLADGEADAEVYCGAVSRDQSKLVWMQARAIVEQSPLLSKYVTPYESKNTLHFQDKGRGQSGIFRAISREAKSIEGVNSSFTILDELHAHPTSEVWNALSGAGIARSQPMILAITTSGLYRPESIGWKQYEHARSVLEGVIDDPSYYAFIAAKDPEDEWDSIEAMEKANPNLSVSITIEDLIALRDRARIESAYQNVYRQYHTGEWPAQADRWLDMNVWEQGSLPPPESLEGRECYAGLDLASTRDVTALVLVFPPKDNTWGAEATDDGYDVLCRFWVPGDNIHKRVHDDRVPYDAWVRDGHMLATEGNVFDDRAIFEEIMRLRDRYNIREVAYDPHLGTLLAPKLLDAGLEMIPFRQGWASMTGPTKELEKLVYAGRIRHDGHPVLRWMAANVSLWRDPADNIKIDKAKSFEKVDGMVALVMALDRAMSHAQDNVWPSWGAV